MGVAMTQCMESVLRVDVTLVSSYSESMRKTFGVAALMLAVSMFGTGCLSKMVLNGTIASTRKGSAAFATIGDYELARSAASAGLVQFEGYHELAPTNENAYFLLIGSWMRYGYAFPEDDMEAALEAGDEDLAEYHKKRALMAYNRSLGYGIEWLNMRAEGFEAAKKNNATIAEWLKKNFKDKEDAEWLYLIGQGWMAKTNLAKDDPAVVADLFVGVALAERAAELDPTPGDYGVYAALGAYHSRNSMAELDKAKDFFEKAIEKTGRKAQLNLLGYGARYACIKGDKALFEKTLNEILENEDPEKKLRLVNAVAKRRANRYLNGKIKKQDCGFDTHAAASEPAPKAEKTPAEKGQQVLTDPKPASPAVKPVAPVTAPKAPSAPSAKPATPPKK